MAKEKKLAGKSREKPISEVKIKAVSELENLIKNNRTFMICSIKGLPGKQFQIVKKKLRDQARVKVVKKSIALRAVENSKIDKKIEAFIIEDSALIFSNTDAFELSAMLSENKNPIAAKAGQIAPEDIIVEPGPTELVPGPVISELGALGLKIAIEDGKINIKEKKVIVKSGDVINENAASLMAKLDIKPFSIGFEPVAAYDSKEKKVYSGIKINKEKELEDLKYAHGKSVAFAVKLAYACKETIGFLLGKAASHEKALSTKVNTETKS